MFLFLSVFLVSCIVVLLCEKTAVRVGFVDQPGHRKIHQISTPRNGGLVIFLVVLLSVFYYKVKSFEVFVPSMSLVFLGGLIDDFRRKTPAFFKLIFQAAGSAIFLIQLDLPWFLKLFLFVFQIGITNSFNLMDNMNGVTALLSFGIMAVLFSLSRAMPMEFVICFFAASLAFLTRNYFKGKIFLGDQGSQFLGFLLSSLFITECLHHQIFKPILSQGVWVQLLCTTLMIFCIFSIFIIDTFWVIYVRLRNGQSIFNGDQNHLTHNLHRKGVPKFFVPWVLMIFQWPILALSFRVWTYFVGSSS